MPSTRFRLTLLLLLLTLLAPRQGTAQDRRLVPLDHWAYEYIHRLQLRGHLLDLHPTAQPYTYGQVAAAATSAAPRRLDRRSRRWLEVLAEAFPRRRSGRRPLVAAEIQPGVRVSTTTRLDPLRPAPDDEATLTVGSTNVYPQVAGRLSLQAGPAVAQAGLRFDTYYRDDPDGLDAANRLIVRNEDSYLGVSTTYVSAYTGRIGHHWATPGQTALVLSDNAVGFDQIFLRLGTSRVALRSVVGELDSVTEDGRFTGVAGSDSVEASIRRYVSAHRFDWRPSRHVALTIMESTIYSGESSGFSLKYLNPLVLHAFAVDGRPKNDENNGLVAGMLWVQAGRWTLQGELLLDDADLMNSTNEPASLAVTGSLAYAGLPAADLGGSITAVSARTYNTHQPEGRYTHLVRGLGAPFNDYVHASAHATFYLGGDGLDVAVTPRFDALLQGAARIHMPYPPSSTEADFILNGPVQEVLRPALELRIQHGRALWLRIDGGPAIIRNESHAEGADRTVFTLTASLVARLAAVDRLRPSP